MLRQLFRRLPFTLVMLVGLVLVALLTETNNSRLTEYWLTRLGFAPNDLWLLRLERIFTSAMVTYGGRVFWEALVMFVLALGLSEWLVGTRRTALTFWGIHVVVLLAESLFIVLPIRLGNLTGGEMVNLERDVGPSVGYFACLGLVCAWLPRKWRWISVAMVMAGLVISIFFPPGGGESAHVKLLSDIAHLMGFTLGWLSFKKKDNPRIQYQAS